MTKPPGGITVTGFISPTDDTDTYPTHQDNFGKGGIHSVATIIDRDAISPDRRTVGMLCYVEEDNGIYQLVDGIDNINWVLVFNIDENGILVNANLPYQYILEGDINGKAIASPVLLDTRLDLARMRAAEYIISRPNEKLPQATVLSQLPDGFMKNVGGDVVITDVDSGNISISEDKLLTGDANGEAIEVDKVKLKNLPSFFTINPLQVGGLYNLYTGSANPLNLAEPTTTLTLQRCNMAGLTPGYLNIGAVVLPTEDPFNFGINRPVEIQVLPIDNMAALGFDKLWIGNVFDRPAPVDNIDINHLPNLTYESIWRGDINGRPIESSDLTTAISNIDELSSQLYDAQLDIIDLQTRVAALEADVIAIEGEIAAIEAEIAGIQAELVLIEAAIAALQVQTAALEVAVAQINVELDQLRLNNIPTDADITVSGYKIIDLGDPTLPTDAVNLQTLEGHIANLDVTLSGFVTGGPAVGGVMPTAIGPDCQLQYIPAGGDVDFGGFTIFNILDINVTADAYVAGTIYGKGPYGTMYMNNNLVSTIVPSNTYTAISGTSIFGNSNLFMMPANNALQYNGLAPIDMHLTYNASLKKTSAGTNDNVILTLFVNSTHLLEADSETFVTANQTSGASGQATITLNPGDIISPMLFSTNNITIIPRYLTITARSL